MLAARVFLLALVAPQLAVGFIGASSRALDRTPRGALAAGAAAEDVPAVIVGGGRIGSLLAELGCEGDAVMRRGDAFPADAPSSGPIYVCTRNDALEGVIAATPAERRKDLVFLQVRAERKKRERSLPALGRTRARFPRLSLPL